jgi:hypothetical protein
MLNKANSKKIIYIAVSILLVIGLAFFIKLQWFTFESVVIDNDHLIDNVTPSTEATWVNLEGGNTEENIVAESSLVVEGKVISQTVKIVKAADDNDEGIYFTVSKISVSEILAKSSEIDEDILQINKNDELIVSVTQTGAIVKGEEKNIIADAPLIEKGKTYVLFLDKFGDGTFVPIAGRLGVAEVIKGELEFTNAEAKDAMISFEGEKADDVADNLAQYEDDENNTLIVNSEGDPAPEFLKE